MIWGRRVQGQPARLVDVFHHNCFVGVARFASLTSTSSSDESSLRVGVVQETALVIRDKQQPQDARRIS